MTARETLRGPPFECPECGDDYQRIGRHWGATCDPALSDHQRSVLAGLALSGSTVDDGNIIIQTTTRPLIEWTVGQLGWLAGSLTRIHDDTDNREPIYRLSTPKHWSVEQYDGWPSNGPPAEYELDATAARAWWAYAGGLEWHGEYDSQRTGTISAEADDRAAWVQRVLATAGVDATRVGKRVQWHGEQLREWLDWTGEPVPGVEYKWTDSLLDYRLATTDTGSVSDTQTARYTTALEIARERTSAELTPEEFDAQIDAVAADDVADWLGGGNWEDALSVAGVSRDGVLKKQKSGVSQGAVRRGRGTRYDRDDCIEALQAAAAELGEALTAREYADWAAESQHPSRGALQRHLGSWVRACKEADVEAKGQAKGEYSREGCIEALRTAASELGEPVRQTEYNEWVAGSNHRPPVSALNRQFGSWLEACTEADIKAAGHQDTTYKDFVAALVETRKELGRWPTSTQYGDWRPQGAPSRAWVYQQDEHESWQHAIDLAKEQFDPTSTE